MSDAIVKYQDRIPLPPDELLRFLKKLLDDAAARGRTFVCHEPRGAELIEDDDGAVVGLRISMVGPAGREFYDIPAWAIADVPADEADTLGLQSGAVRDCLEEFCNDIDASGGCTRAAGDDRLEIAAVPEWSDLAVTYENACRALLRAPVVEDDP
jgi:hypothetical protein